jgi:hypothetical protein
MENGSDVIYQGPLRKKGGRVNVWSERFFVLKGSTLFYYVKSTDAVRSVCMSALPTPFLSGLEILTTILHLSLGAQGFFPTASDNTSVFNNFRHQQEEKTVLLQGDVEGGRGR